MTTGLVPALYQSQGIQRWKNGPGSKASGSYSQVGGTDTLIRSLGNIVTNA